MDCASCKQSMEGCASIKCSLCALQYHLECVSTSQLIPSTNSWRCSNCEMAAMNQMGPKVIDTVVSV